MQVCTDASIAACVFQIYSYNVTKSKKTLLLSVPLTSLYIQANNGVSDKDVQKIYTI